MGDEVAESLAVARRILAKRARPIAHETQLSGGYDDRPVESTLASRSPHTKTGSLSAPSPRSDGSAKRDVSSDFVSFELTAETKQDLKALSLRSYVDSKRPFHRDELARSAPKAGDRFQIGVVVDDSFDPQLRLSRKNRKTSFLEQISAGLSSSQLAKVGAPAKRTKNGHRHRPASRHRR